MTAHEYHERTKHTPQSVRSSAHYLDWSSRPHPFKDYLGLDAVALPDPTDTGVPATEALADVGAARAPSLGEIARLLKYAAGVIRAKTSVDGERYFFRTYACAGALYPNEVYLACGALEGIAKGLYHYHPLEHTLRRLRDEDPRPWLARASDGHAAVLEAPAVVMLSGIPWRTTWKYRARGYRHLFWDGGMILANLLALSVASGLACEVVCGFADAEVNALLGLDGRTEMALALAPLGGGAAVIPAAAPPTPLFRQARRLSARVVEEPLLLEAHEATRWPEPPRPPEWTRIASTSGLAVPRQVDGIEQVIRRRGSSRVFLREPIPREAFEAIVEIGMRSVPGDWGRRRTRIHAVVHAVDGLEPGSYRWDKDRLASLRVGVFRDEAEFLCLEQPLGGQAAATCFLTADLNTALAELGDRGYRAAQLEAGIAAGRMYLTAYAHGLGATGLTFYDDEVRRFFETDEEPMLVVATGVDGRRRLLQAR